PKRRFPTAQDMAEAIGGGSEKSPGFPHLVVLGKKCRVKKEIEIGRDHKSCDQGCTKKGFGRPPEIGILDAERYLSKHHARVERSRGHRDSFSPSSARVRLERREGPTGRRRQSPRHGDPDGVPVRTADPAAPDGGGWHGRPPSRGCGEPNGREGGRPNDPAALDDPGGHPARDVRPGAPSRR